MSEYKGVQHPDRFEDSTGSYKTGWEDGVDAALASRSRADGGVLKITGWSRDVVRAFAHIVDDNPDAARHIVSVLPPKERAVLSFWLHELSEITDTIEVSRRMEDASRTRRALRDTDRTPDTNPLESALDVLSQIASDTDTDKH